MSITTRSIEAHAIRQAFDPDALRRVCTAEPEEFAAQYDMTRAAVDQMAPHDFYLFKDNGASVLFVAHLDNVDETRRCDIMDTASGPVVFSPALDDRLGAYVGLHLLPALGLEFDYLLTVGEEHGMTTAAYFDPAAHGVEDRYDWIIEFDRGGTDVVLYQYEDDDLVNRVRQTGARVEQGIFSDISEMEQVGVKAMNWGVGYRDYHGPRSHAWLADTFAMVGFYLDFHHVNDGVRLVHHPVPRQYGGFGLGSGSHWSKWGWDEPYAGADGEYDAEDCTENLDSAHECGGTVTDTRYGLLCDAHRKMYFED